MSMRKLTIPATALFCLLAGWSTGNLQAPVEAQRRPTRERIADPELEKLRQQLSGQLQALESRFSTGRPCRFIIMALPGVDRGEILLNECTGESWYYDNGWEPGERALRGSFERDRRLETHFAGGSDRGLDVLTPSTGARGAARRAPG